MPKNLILFILLLPLNCFAQFTISGKILNGTDKTPVADASIFLSNTGIGAKTDASGSFVLNNIKPGKYELVASIIGFEPYKQSIIVDNNISLPVIGINPQSIALTEVKIKSQHDPYRARNLDWFKNDFLGSSYRARECTILNPDILYLDYNDDTKILTASSDDFVIIENAALGYRVKYLLANFTMTNPGELDRKIHYEGSVLFENMKGSASQLRKWQSRRQEIYEGSEMHFLRAALNNRIKEDGFRVFYLESYTKPGSSKIRQRLVDSPLAKKDIVQATDQAGLFSFGHNGDPLHISYNKDHHFYGARLANLNSVNNPDQTMLIFNKPQVLFDKNGGVLNPDDLSFSGAWARDRMAELLPVDYEEPQQNANIPASEAEGSPANKLKNFLSRHNTEKVYLHFDKPYYVAGDSIYFKAYVTLGAEHRLSDSSGVLHVDLINTNNKIDQSVKLKLTNGISWGDFALPDSLPKGNYRVRAYTQWMRNNGGDGYFDQNILVATLNNDKIPENGPTNTTTKAVPDVQFFPEGGQLVAGIDAKIAFKAVTPGGLGLDARGVVLDEENKEVATFASVHNGMGCFYLTPEIGKAYRAKLTYPDGTQTTINLPGVNENGIALSVNNDSIPKATVKIAVTKSYYQLNKNKIYHLLIYSGGAINALDVPLDSMMVKMDVLKRRLHTGIATITLFSPEGEPLCERLLFVQNYDQLSIALNSNKTVYHKRENTKLGLTVINRAGEAVEGHFSVSVVNENIVPSDENAEHTILTDLLLTSDLKGYVEHPNYYFTNITAKTLADLDLVMLTNGYRRFEWKKVLAYDNSPLVYQPEKALQISGLAESLSGKPLVKGTVSLISKRDGAFISTATDKQGQFQFNNLDFADTAKFILQAVDAKGKSDTKLTYNGNASSPLVLSKLAKNEEISKSLSSYVDNEKTKQEEITKLGGVNEIRLKEVDVNAVKIKEQYKTQSLVGAGNANQVVHSDVLDRINGSLSDKILGQFYGRGKYWGLVVVDGVYMKDRFDINELNGSDVAMVEMIYGGNAAMYGMRAKDGVMVITTKQGKPRELKDIPSFGVLPIYPRGYYKAREFYMPQYDHSNLTDIHPDLRSTIYWKPETVTGTDGKASLNFFNADTPGTYKVTIQGIDDNGNLGVQVYRYQVE